MLIKSNSAKRCKSCNKKHNTVIVDDVKCVDMMTVPSKFGFFCDSNCVADYVRDNPTKIKREYAKKVRADKIAYNADDIKIRKKAAKTACHLYIRTRDVNKGCISCENSLVGTKFDAGHLIESGNYPFIRYHEDNIFGQCVHCNQHKGGNQVEAKKGAIKRIGEDRVNWLYESKNKPIKRTIEDYREIERYYKEKLKHLKRTNNENF